MRCKPFILPIDLLFAISGIPYRERHGQGMDAGQHLAVALFSVAERGAVRRFNRGVEESRAAAAASA